MITKQCENSGKLLYQCPECKDWDYDDITHIKKCRVCYEMEHNPELFTLSKEDDAEWGICADYIMDNNLSPNLDSPEE
jgi:hypothetical protein